MLKNRLVAFRILLVSVVFQLATGCVTSRSDDLPYIPGKRYLLTILHTNDTHGRFWKSKDGAYGFSAQATLVKKIRDEVTAAGGHVLLFSGGDVNTGTPASDLLDAEPDFKAMQRMGYDAMALGNHEFDNTRAVLDKQAGWAGFPFLAANIYEKGTRRRAFTPHVIKELEGLKIGVVGLTTEETAVIANKKYVGAYEFRPALEEAKELVPGLDKETGLVIVLSHLGYYRQEQNRLGDVTLAREVDGIDVIVGGHTHVALTKPDTDHGTVIVQAGEWGKYLGRLDLVFQDGRLTMTGYRLIPVNFEVAGTASPAATIPEDPKMQAFLKPYFDRTNLRLQEVIATVDADFLGQPSSRDRETNLGRLVADAVREATHADVALINNGGLRVDWKKGSVTFGDLLELLPFGSSLCSADLNGRELRNYFEHLLNGVQTAHFTNVRMQTRRQAGRIIPVSIRVGGKPIADGARYRMAANCFSLAGGDRYPDLSVLPSFKDHEIRDADAVHSFLMRRHARVRAKDFATPSVTGPLPRKKGQP